MILTSQLALLYVFPTTKSQCRILDKTDQLDVTFGRRKSQAVKLAGWELTYC